MQLERLSVSLRPRNAWESLDLGFLLMRQCAPALFKIWLALLLPFAAVLYLSLYRWPLAAPLLLWWLKPLYDRILLFFFSRAVFGDAPGLRATWRALPGLSGKSRLLWSLTLGRFDPARSFTLPIWQLEGLRGAEGRRRALVLQKQAHNQAVWLTVVCIHLQWVVYFGLAGVLFMLAPSEYDLDWWALFAPDPGLHWMYLGDAALNVLGLLLIEPFYVAAGFTLYLNRRTRLEGWDIELTLRRLEQRLQS